MSDAPRRLALVVHALHGGGAERLMSQLAERWARAGHSITLVTLDHVASDQYRVGADVARVGLGVMGHSRNPLAAWLAVRRRLKALRRALQAAQPELVLSFCDRTNILCLTAASPMTVPVWIAEHSDPRRQRLPWQWHAWRERVYPQAAGCVALTEEIAVWLQRWFPPERLRVIPPAISPPEISTSAITAPTVAPLGMLNDSPEYASAENLSAENLSAENLSAESSGKESRGTDSQPASVSVGPKSSVHKPQRLLAVGRHSPEKNYASLLAAWAGIEARFPGWTLTLAGDGPEHDRLVAAASDLLHRGRVEFIGWVQDPWPLYRAASAFVLPSDYEGVPLVLLEAMSQRVPAIATACCDSVARWAARGAVQLAGSGSPAELAQAMTSLLSDANRREELAKRGTEIAANYTWREVGPAWDALLADLPTKQVGRV
jgi:GalNAc-alpha-(1->4)-GalNAc-alpha-(1->3)-diNAcBac-PP-undecaprenol alpha-1,4-N-acetyl-D-galactosaminyltransferase